MTGMTYCKKAEINTKLTEKIKDHAAKTYPYECCGILLGRQNEDGTVTVTDIRKAANMIKGTNGGICFEIDPLEIYRLEKETEGSTSGIIGFYHSHPDKMAVLSKDDRESMLPGLLYVLVSVYPSGCRDISAWSKTGGTIKQTDLSAPLLQR